MLALPFIVLENVKEEIRYYQGIFGGKIEVLRRQGEDVLNADLHARGAVLRFADAKAAKPPPVGKGDHVRVILHIDTEEELRRIYGALSAEGKVHAEVYEAPFDGLLAVVSDRNGVHWVLAHYRRQTGQGRLAFTSNP